MAAENLVFMGVVGRPHGLRGEISVDWRGEHEPEPLETLYLAHADSPPIPREIKGVRWHKGRPLLTLNGSMSRDDAEALKGASVFMKREDLPQPEADEAFLADLIGCQVSLANGEKLGVLDHVEFPAGREIWAIKRDSGSDILFPANPQFIMELDPGGRRVVVDPPPGLIDIYKSSSEN